MSEFEPGAFVLPIPEQEPVHQPQVEPTPAMYSGDWQEVAICRDTDPALFFPTDYYIRGRGRGRYSEEALAAKAICAMCDVQPECLEYALNNREDDGIWGGTTPQERTSIIRRRRRYAS